MNDLLVNFQSIDILYFENYSVLIVHYYLLTEGCKNIFKFILTNNSMKKAFAILSLFLISGSVYSQKIHSTNEILKIMSSSKIGYQVKMLDKPVSGIDYSEKLNLNDSYRIVTDSNITTSPYTVNTKAEPKLQKAEIYFQAKDYENALAAYKTTLEVDSSLYFIMTYIGQMYEKNRDYQNSIFWYRKAISKNYIDYMAHWFLADNYITTNNLKNSIDEIVIARILNRNHRRIKQSMNSIFSKAKRDTTDWYFNPQIEIKKLSDSTVSVAMDNKWVGYAMAKALWMYEPGYSESMGVPKGQHSTLEDRECLLALIVAQVNAKTKINKDPQLRILKEAAEKNMLDEYILYEIILPGNPSFAFQLSEKMISGIKDYVLNVRNKRK